MEFWGGLVVLKELEEQHMTWLQPKTYLRAYAMSVVLTLTVLIAAHGEECSAGSPHKEGNGRTVEKVHIVAERFNFTPSKIKAKQGVLLEITLTSEDTFHGFRIAAAKINQVIPARGRGSVKVMFDAKEKGTYAFECSRPCGAGHTMMRGVIVVE